MCEKNKAGIVKTPAFCHAREARCRRLEGIGATSPPCIGSPPHATFLESIVLDLLLQLAEKDSAIPATMNRAVSFPFTFFPNVI